MPEKPATKTAILKGLAEKTGMSKKDVATFMEALSEMIRQHLGKKGPGVFTVPGVVKLKTIKKPATPARPGRNPKTGEPIMIAAKPARKIVKAYPLKVLKDSVLSG